MIAVRSLIGSQMDAALEDLAHLRIRVFADWPYLYDGEVEYERQYLSGYAWNPTAVLVGAFDGARLVGAATGMALEAHKDDFTDALTNRPEPMETVFYCAESVLLPEYRGQRLGHRFFDLREAHGRDLGRTTSTFCAVIRPEDHPARPTDYRPLDPFWRKRGYSPWAGCVAYFGWRDIGDKDETRKPLQFWGKAL